MFAFFTAASTLDFPPARGARGSVLAAVRVRAIRRTPGRARRGRPPPSSSLRGAEGGFAARRIRTAHTPDVRAFVRQSAQDFDLPRGRVSLLS